MKFIEYFFSPPPIMKKSSSNYNHQFIKVILQDGHLIWPHLSTIDILNFSVTSKTSAGFILSEKSVNAIIQADHRVSQLGHFQITSSTQMTLGMLRRTLFRLVQDKTISIFIGTNGRILLDIGSAFNDRDAYLTSATVLPKDVGDMENLHNTDEGLVSDAGEGMEVVKDMCIEKRLEIVSYDEYDDFTPRHPLPKEKTHRRGNSLFNSDIEMYANQALNQCTSFSNINSNSIYSTANNNTVGNEFTMDDIATLALLELNDEPVILTEAEVSPTTTNNQHQHRRH